MNDAIILEVALNGLTTREQNPHVPLSADEIAESALRCLEAGASVVHYHVADVTAAGAEAAALYERALRPVLARRPDALFYPTVAFAGPVETRFEHFEHLAKAGLLRLGLVDPGSVNLGVVDDEGLPAPLDLVYKNSFYDARHQITLCDRLALGPSVSIFEPGFLRAALAYHRRGRLPAGAMIKLYFGGDEGYFGRGGGAATFGLPPTRAALEAYLELLQGTGLPWSAAVMGGDVLAGGFADLALERGGHLRVGLEDYAGPARPSNEELVAAAAALVRRSGRDVATCEQAARLLGLPPRPAS
jgi:3-keto-5-aminohexanoate cleavage enzyme